jgi:membrane protein DedA with SNARE-associated domain/rhodanese-related sulfurtransferase
MNALVDQLLHYGYAAVFLYVLASQLGIPVPSAPLLLAVGALAATGRVGLAPAGAAVVLACLSADSIWYKVGRTRGRQVVRLLCRLSLEPGSCVQKTEVALHRYGIRFLLVAKFLPGIGLMAAPIAGESRTPFARFLAFDGLGALLWASTYLLLGRFLGSLLGHNARLLHLVAELGAGALLGIVLGLVLIRLIRRHRFRRQLTSVGISATELKEGLDRGESFYLVDIRPFARGPEHEPSLPGAVHLSPDQALVDGAIPRNREVVFLCDCPGDAGSAQVSTTLKRRGFQHVRHLKGGLEGWTGAGYSLTGPPGALARSDA